MPTTVSSGKSSETKARTGHDARSHAPRRDIGTELGPGGRRGDGGARTAGYPVQQCRRLLSRQGRGHLGPRAWRSCQGVFLVSRTAIPAMCKGSGGSIINASSVMGLVGSPASRPGWPPRAPSRLLPSRRRCNMQRKISASTRCIGLYGYAADRAALQRSGRAPNAARSHADGQARHRRGYRQWRAPRTGAFRRTRSDRRQPA